MRVIKKSSDEETAKLVYPLFDAILGELYLENFFDEVELFLGNKDKVFAGKNKLVISLDCRNDFIQSRDKKATRAILLHQIFHGVSGKYLKGMPHFIEDIIINKEMIKRGYGDDLIYYYYLYLMGHGATVADLEDFLNVNVPWLSFHSLDEYNSDFLKKIIARFRDKKRFEKSSKELFSALQKNLWKRTNQKTAVNAYKKLRVL